MLKTSHRFSQRIRSEFVPPHSPAPHNKKKMTASNVFITGPMTHLAEESLSIIVTVCCIITVIYVFFFSESPILFAWLGVADCHHSPQEVNFLNR